MDSLRWVKKAVIFTHPRCGLTRPIPLAPVTRGEKKILLKLGERMRGEEEMKCGERELFEVRLTNSRLVRGELGGQRGVRYQIKEE